MTENELLKKEFEVYQKLGFTKRATLEEYSEARLNNELHDWEIVFVPKEEIEEC